jgi:predicted ATP-binding protein involved in virulence
MKIKEVSINQIFDKNIKETFTLSDKINVFYGVNGIGKSSLLEIIFEIIAYPLTFRFKFNECKIVTDKGTIQQKTSGIKTRGYNNFKYDNSVLWYDHVENTWIDKQYKEKKYISLENLSSSKCRNISNLFYSMTGKYCYTQDNSPVILSEGEKKLLSFLLLTEWEEPLVVFIDNIEQSLHIDWQRQIIDYLVKTPHQIIATTHSPIIVNKATDYQVFELKEFN